MKFVIMSLPNNTGGAIVRENLCRILRKLGHDAKIIMPQVGSNRKNTPYFLTHTKFVFTNVIGRAFKGTLFNMKGCKLKLFPFVDKKTIVIYPQLTFGNPLKAKNVVRWFLHCNPHVDTAKAYGKGDLFFT